MHFNLLGHLEMQYLPLWFWESVQNVGFLPAIQTYNAEFLDINGTVCEVMFLSHRSELIASVLRVAFSILTLLIGRASGL